MDIHITQHAIDRFIERHAKGMTHRYAGHLLRQQAATAVRLKQRTNGGQEQWQIRQPKCVLVVKWDDGKAIVATVIPKPLQDGVQVEDDDAFRNAILEHVQPVPLIEPEPVGAELSADDGSLQAIGPTGRTSADQQARQAIRLAAKMTGQDLTDAQPLETTTIDAPEKRAGKTRLQEKVLELQAEVARKNRQIRWFKNEVGIAAARFKSDGNIDGLLAHLNALMHLPRSFELQAIDGGDALQAGMKETRAYLHLADAEGQAADAGERGGDSHGERGGDSYGDRDGDSYVERGGDSHALSASAA